MKITDVAIDRPVFTTMVMMGALVLGLLALSRLGVDLFPDTSFPVVTIVTPYPGAGPEEVEQQVTKKIEEAVSAVNGVDELRSYSRDSVSTVVVMFEMEADIRQAVSDVRDKVAMARGVLPREIEDPVVSRVDPSAMPVVTYAVSSQRGSLETRKLADDVIRPAVERAEGVGSVSLIGGEVREIRVELDRESLEGSGLGVAQVAQTIGAESYDLPGGRVTTSTTELSVKVVGSFRDPKEIGDVVLLTRPNGTQVRVRDVATVRDTVAEVRTLTRVNGVPSVLFEVQKQSGTNAVAVTEAVQSAVDKLKGTLPEDVKVTQVIDMASFIRTNIHNLTEHLLVGGLLAILVIFLFMLDWRSTAISSISLPVSVIFTFFVMWQLDFTLNMMSMMALTLAIGLLIDDSVVVRENIFRHMERGSDPITAAREGTREIGLAVLATTFTVIAVFAPVAFTGGLIGSMFRQFGLTVAAATLVSMLVSFTIDPMLSARVTQKIPHDYHERMRRHWAFGPIVRFYDALDEAYRSTLGWALRWRKTTVLLALALFVGALQLTKFMGQEFIARQDQGDLTVTLEMPAGTRLVDMDAMAAQVEAVFRAVPEVHTVATTVGPSAQSNKATMRVKATPRSQRERPLWAIMEEVRPKLAALPSLTFSMREAGLGGAAESAVAQAPVTLYVQGPDYGELGRLAQRAFEIVRTTPGVRDPDLSFRPGYPEKRLVIDRSVAADRGVAFSSAAVTLRTAVEGDVVAKFRDGDDESDIRVQLRPEERGTLEDLLDLSVPSRTGKPVHLRDVMSRQDAATPVTIERLDRQRQIAITANVMGRPLSDVLGDVQQRLNDLSPEEGYSFRFAGEAQRMKETFDNLGIAMVLALVFIYLVLASQFESFVHPFTIMLALPLAIVGALGTLFFIGKPMGMSAMIGIILLMGLVTKNSILLVDYANQMRDRGRGIVDALIEAGSTRLRPILMTSAAMVLGMLPSALGTGEGSEFRSPMSWAVIGGVITSTLLTLVVVPAVYVWMDRLTIRGWRERRATRVAAAARLERSVSSFAMGAAHDARE